MPRKNIKGLYKDKKTGYYYINKQMKGIRIHQSTGLRNRISAENELDRIINIYNKTTCSSELTFRDASIRHLISSRRKDLDKDAGKLARLYPFIAHIELKTIDRFSLEPFLTLLRLENKKTNTINSYLALIRLILRKCNCEWKREDGNFWLTSLPHIPLESVFDARMPYPLSWPEQDLLFPLLPEHLKPPILFGLNTGLRDSEICNLKWSYLRRVPDSESLYFIIPASSQKNKKSRLIVLNSVGHEIIKDLWHLKSNDYVFNYKQNKLTTLRNDGWLNAVKNSVGRYENKFLLPCPEEFKRLRIHDLRHTVGRRLRAAEVPELDIAAILGHSSFGGVTAHYADAEIFHLVRQLEKIAQPQKKTSSSTIRAITQKDQRTNQLDINKSSNQRSFYH